ncbi:hypothetical protein CDL12_00355 [Handroanthus impetiginosus]|uniref:S-protein homolog n=1 Tax=Handroanthus impetiginosus TaxID=429701 RepID=A0A2G9IAS4_9LAMI|nr:hypothetical protein CDL12_00355 [Handroanthus impetiginosus]
MSSTTTKSLFSLLVLWFYLCDLTKIASSSNTKTVAKDHELHIINKFSSKIDPGEIFSVHVVNNLPSNTSPLSIHCSSKNDDLGNHALYVNDDFHWHFGMNFWFTTLFFCRFQWEGKNVAFDVFNARLAKSYCESDQVESICLWSVKQDGFYIGNQIPPARLTKLHDW